MKTSYAYRILAITIIGAVAPIIAFTIVIDPGHGGKFTGGIGVNKIQEKEWTLSCATKLAELLKKDNTVILTRTTDKQFHDDLLEDLRIRAEYSRKHNADLFISLHYNTSTGKYIRGYEVYVPFSPEFPAASYAAAGCIHHELSQTIEPHWSGSLGNLNDYDRGIRAARFHVLRNHNCPAVLIELEYITHAACVAQLQDQNYLDKIVQAVARGIAQFKKERSRKR